MTGKTWVDFKDDERPNWFEGNTDYKIDADGVLWYWDDSGIGWDYSRIEPGAYSYGDAEDYKTIMDNVNESMYKTDYNPGNLDAFATEADQILQKFDDSFNKIITSGAVFGDGSSGGKFNYSGQTEDASNFTYYNTPNYLMNMANDVELATRLNAEYKHLGFYFYNCSDSYDGICAKYHGRQYDYAGTNFAYKEFGGYDFNKGDGIKYDGYFKSNPASTWITGGSSAGADKKAIKWGQEIIDWMKKMIREDEDLQGVRRVTGLG